MNLNKIKGKIAEQGKKKSDSAQYIGITPQSLNKKLNGKVKMTTEDAKKVCEFLNIVDYIERTEIFLS